MLTLYVEGIGLAGPGFFDWTAAEPFLAGRTPYMPAPFVTPVIDLLPPAERRRVSVTVKLALSIAQQAVKAADRDAATLASVFASSGGDGDTIHAILETLLTPDREVSPTRFHNSVHNAPSGYWGLATQCREPSTTICAHDWTFGAALLEAAAQLTADKRPMLLVAYDKAYPEPLNHARPIAEGFGVALVLAPQENSHSVARLTLDVTEGPTVDSMMADERLERLRRENPAARALPLLGALARAVPETVILESAPGLSLRLAVTTLRSRS
jgi:hypothetical protein